MRNEDRGILIVIALDGNTPGVGLRPNVQAPDTAGYGGCHFATRNKKRQSARAFHKKLASTEPDTEPLQWALVAVMQSAHFRDLHHGTEVRLMKPFKKAMVGPIGLEPLTSTVSR